MSPPVSEKKMFRAIASRSLRLPVSSRAPVLFAPQAVRTYAAFPSLTRDLTKERIFELLEGFSKIDGKEIQESSAYINDLGLDSLDVVEVLMEVEHEFNIQIPDEEADSLKSVSQTIDYIMKQPDAC